MALEFPGLQKTRAAANVKSQQQLGMAAPGGARQLAQQQGMSALTQAAGQQSASVQAAQTQQLAQQAQTVAGQGQQALQVEAADKQDQMAQQKLRLSQQSRQLSQMLSQQQAAESRQLYDSNLQFQRDEIGRTLFNERQLADYALNNSKSLEDLLAYEQEAQQATERLQYTYQQAYKVLEQQEQNLLAQENQYLSQEQSLQIAQAKAALEQKIQKAKNKAANTSAIFGAITSIGAVVTPIFPPAGIAMMAVGAGGQMLTADKAGKV